MDAVAASIIGLFVGLASWLLSKVIPLGFVRDFLASAVLGLGCILFVYYIPIGEHLQPIISGTIMPLVPGIAFTNGIRDIANGDYISGAVRMLDAILIFLSIAIGMGVMFMIYHTLTGGVMP